LPEATPYFDIIRYKMTPMDQLIPHLVVQCGEKHVTPVCKTRLSILTGKESALFLPRYAFSTMEPEQAKRHFEVHQKWSRSLKTITPAPKISHLNQQRVEYFDNGTILKRSTLEWVLSLTLVENGQSAHCDVVNGGTDRKATLVCPESYMEQANKEWRQYKSRLNPPNRRESRYRESVSGLPDFSLIHSIEIETNVSMLEKNLSAADVRKQAPPSVKEPHPEKPKSKRSHKTKGKNEKTQATDRQQTEDTDISHSNTFEIESVTPTGDTYQQEDSDMRSTASTAKSTNAPFQESNSRFKEFERMIKNAEKRSVVEGKASAAQLSGLKSQFNELDGKMSALQPTQQQLATELTST
jgi:hypothetical protein